MNLYSIPTLISFIFTLFLAFFVLYNGRYHIANKAFALAIFSVSIMEFGNFMVLNSLYLPKLLFWGRISLVGCCLIPANWSLFSLVFTRNNFSIIPKSQKIILLVIYTFSFFFLVFIPSDLFLTLIHMKFYEQEMFFLGTIGRFFSIFLLLVIVFILLNLETIYRNSKGVEKWRIKYSIIGMFVTFTFFIFVISRIIIFRFVTLDFLPIGSLIILICSVLLAFNFIKYRLMNIDIFISRQVFYGSFTLVAIGSYLILVGLAGELVKRSKINFNLLFYPIFILLSLMALSVLLISKKTRKKVTRFIDRHFYKNKYDYRFEWIELTNIISSVININDLLRKFMDLIADTMCVNEILVWLYDENNKQFQLASSRCISVSENVIDKESPLIKFLKEKAEPFSIHSKTSDDSISEFYNANKAFLDKFRVSVISPLIMKDEFMGFITLGEEITGMVYNYEDYDMLKTMCHQTANAIMNMKLSERLVLAKEMEVMNKISSFVIHDLKNSISMLSLITQNAAFNMDNPEFQKDVLETIAKAIGNMKELMARISSLPKEIVLNKTKCNITELLRYSITRTGLGNNGIILEERYADLPVVNLDQEKIQSVFNNLIINAQELLKNKGIVSISTFYDDEKIIVEFKDNGPGMSREFQKNKLFKPFQTTKREGLGIGLYQCKIIIAAHGGKIEVESEEGKGTQFRIYLPVEN